MTLRSLVAAAVAAFFMTAASGAQATAPAPKHVTHAQHAVSKGKVVTATIPASRIGVLRVHVWSCQRQMGQDLSKAAQPVRDLASTPVAYRLWTLKLWQSRLDACVQLRATSLPYTNDWQTAVKVVQRVYPGSDWWLLSCSGSEGGHGVFVWIGHASSPPYGVNDTPGGWMQYKQPTFNGDFQSAVADLHARGIHVPPAAASYYQPLGQAIAAGWAYKYGNHSSAKWTGDGCS